MKDFLEIISSFFGEYFSYTLNALTLRDIWFKPSEIETEEKRKTLTINPKQIIFTIFNLLIGLSVINTIKEVDFSDIAPNIVMAIVLWFLWSALCYVICYLLQLRSLTFLNSLALSLQTFGIVYVLASILTVLGKTLIKYPDSDLILELFIEIQFVLLLLYISIAYLKYYNYRFKIQPIIAGILCSLTYSFMNFAIVTNSENSGMTYGGVPTTEYLVIDASSLPKGYNVKNILDDAIINKVGSIIVVGDSISSVDIRDGKNVVDSFLSTIKPTKQPDTMQLVSFFRNFDNVSNFYFYSNFNWAKDEFTYFVTCDTIFANYLYTDSSKIKNEPNLEADLDSTLKKRDIQYQKLVFSPRILKKPKEIIQRKKGG